MRAPELETDPTLALDAVAAADEAAKQAAAASDAKARLRRRVGEPALRTTGARDGPLPRIDGLRGAAVSGRWIGCGDGPEGVGALSVPRSGRWVLQMLLRGQCAAPLELGLVAASSSAALTRVVMRSTSKRSPPRRGAWTDCLAAVAAPRRRAACSE